MSAIAWIEWCVVPPAAPRTKTGRCGSSRARSSVVRMMQQPPSEITQQSSLCSGSATSFDDEHVVDGDRVAVHRVRVPARVLAGLHRDRRQLLGRRAVLVHVPLRGHRVRADERDPGRELVGHRAAASRRHRARRRHRCRACGPNADELVVAVDDRDGVDVAGLDRAVRVQRVELEARAADRSSTRASAASARGTRRAAPRASRRSPRWRGRRRRAGSRPASSSARRNACASSIVPVRFGATGPSASPTPTTHTFRLFGRFAARVTERERSQPAGTPARAGGCGARSAP